MANTTVAKAETAAAPAVTTTVAAPANRDATKDLGRVHVGGMMMRF